MTPEELPRPRWLRIADYPGMTIGDSDKIFTSPDISSPEADAIMRSYYERFPAIYRELQWWEMREPEELPKYVKFTTAPLQNPIPTVPLEDFDAETNCFKYRDMRKQFVENAGEEDCWMFVLIDNRWQPATEEEFNAYEQYKKNNCHE